ncbi:MAG TPA: mechanosensitive ion channel family protein [Clostridia bacterium]|nr:mechanosensitive ion channel family protein [Clostridia bacterium]
MVIQQITIAAGIFLLFLLLQRFLAREIIALILRIAKQTPTEFDDQLVKAFEKPLQLFFVVLGIYLALMYLPLRPEYNQAVIKLFRSVLIILATYGFYNLAGSHEISGTGLTKWFGIELDKSLVPFLSKAVRILIVFLGFVIVAGEWDFDVNGFLAGIGLGGLAFALAAQDTAANIVGGFVILTDKPFSIGDWIQTPSLEGTVEDINFRSTKIRTFADALVTVPNSTLAKEPITNWSRMGKRRITFKLTVPFDTPRESLERCVTGIEEMLRAHPEIHQQTIFSRFDSIGNYGYEIFLYFFTKTTVWAEFLRVKEDVNYRILAIMEREGVTLAMPSTSVYMVAQPEERGLKGFPEA